MRREETGGEAGGKPAGESGGEPRGVSPENALVASPPKTQLRVVSANLFNGAVDPAWLLDFVRSMQADVVALQEATPRHVEMLARELPHGRFDEGDHTGMGIALRNPAVATSVPMSWRHAQHALLAPKDWPQLTIPIDLMNLHVAAPHVGVPPLRSFVMRYRQVRSVEAHFDALPGHGPFARDRGELPRGAVIVGDFNATPRWPVYKRLVMQFKDAALAIAERLRRPAERTWGPWPGSPRLLRIDHGLIRGVEVREFQVAAMAGSDHSAIIVDVETHTGSAPPQPVAPEDAREQGEGHDDQTNAK